MSATDAADYVGDARILAAMRKAKWIVPLIDRIKMVQYDRDDLDSAYARLSAGEALDV
jgi:hypothetical protein